MHDVRYRFHGRVQPPAGRQPLAFVPAAGDEDGTAVLRLYDPIDSWGGDWGVSAKEFAAALDELPAGTERIRLHLNSPGGEVFEGLAILAQLRRHPAAVTTVVDGLAASIASVLALAGDEVVMSRNAELMIHDAWGICMGNAADMRALASTLDHLSDNVASVYAGKAGGTVQDWRDLMLAETWFGADEAVEAGLADRIEGPAPAAAAAAARFDLSGFRYAGRAGAPAPRARAANDEAQRETDLRRHRKNARRMPGAA
jgi:ATP-dependent protease ClpP protease subunit